MLLPEGISSASSSWRSVSCSPARTATTDPPSAASRAQTTSRAYALRLRPNQDFAGALEAFCRERGISSAKLHGGVGSIIGARFADGRSVEPFATEMAVRAGAIQSCNFSEGGLMQRPSAAAAEFHGR